VTGGRPERPPSVLVVDDSEPLRRLMVRALTAAGFTVLEAADGESALRFAGDGALVAVVTDVGLPGMSGLELAAKLTEINPELRVLCTSGLDTPDAPGEFLVKPFAPSVLVQRVRAMLGRDGT
jgi:DNA-binding response OmpR family regulator